MVLVFVLGLLPVAMTARAQGGGVTSDDQYAGDENVMIEPFYEVLGYVGPIRDYTGLIVDRDRLPWAPPVSQLLRNIEIPMLMPGDRRGVGYRTFRGEPPGTDLTVAPRERTREELERGFRELWEIESQAQLIYGLVTPVRPGEATTPPVAPSDRGRENK